MQAEPGSFGTLPPPQAESKDGLEIVKTKPSGKPKIPPGFLMPFNVIGDDDRTEIEDTSDFPNRSICFLRITFADGSTGTGTGWLVAPRTVISAGHCVFDHPTGGRVISVEVTPGASRKNPAPFGSYLCTQVACSEAWQKDGWKLNQPDVHDHDYGAIFLNEDSRVGELLGYFGYQDIQTEILQSRPFCLCGYPSDKPEHSQWYHVRNLSGVNERNLSYEIDTYFGQSGAPVWYVGKDGNRFVIGVHNAGSSRANFATRLNDPVFQQIKTWRAQGS